MSAGKSELLSTDAQVIVDVATRAAEPKELDAGGLLHAVVVPDGGRIEIIDTERRLAEYQDRPRRKLGTISLTDPASLARYVEHHKIEGTELYADWRAQRVTAVLNDHDAEAGWGDHRAVLRLTPSPEWMKWTERDGQLGSQIDFAEHIEDCAPTIVDPSAADLLELAQSFHASTSVEFKSQNRLSDGQVQLRYEETITAKAGTTGQITIPPGFLIRLPVFDGSEPVEMAVRLRYRLRDGRLLIGYVLDGPDLVVREAVGQVVAGIESYCGVVALWGAPRSA